MPTLGGWPSRRRSAVSGGGVFSPFFFFVHSVAVLGVARLEGVCWAAVIAGTSLPRAGHAHLVSCRLFGTTASGVLCAVGYASKGNAAACASCRQDQRPSDTRRPHGSSERSEGTGASASVQNFGGDLLVLGTQRQKVVPFVFCPKMARRTLHHTALGVCRRARLPPHTGAPVPPVSSSMWPRQR